MTSALPPGSNAPGSGHPAPTPGGRGPNTNEAAARPALRLVDVAVGYDTRTVLDHVTLDLPAGALTAVVGPNGGGKSTLLKLVAGLLTPWTGTIEVLGARPGARARDIAYVPQAETVDWGFPVAARDVVMMGRYPRLGPLRRPGAEDQEAVERALSTVGMADLAQRQIGALSGGQRRRVFLARALAAEPDLFLLDEPVTGVDPATQEDLMAVLDAESKAGRTIVASTHDLASAAQHFRSIVAVNGTIVASGDASLVLDTDVLLTTYGGHLLFVGDRAVLVDDAHHHDEAAAGEIHHHEGDEAPRGR